MLQRWRKRASKRVLGWLGRIEGVERPALLLGIALLLLRASTAGRWPERRGDGKRRPPMLARLRERLRRSGG